jgi:DNA-binding response OmpR family regulator
LLDLLSNKRMTSVLLIDDDAELTRLLEEYLQEEQLQLDAVHDGRDGLEKALSRPYSVVVLDVMLPGMSGLDVLKQLRQKSSVPVLMLTARGSELDRILGLELGADDYLAKPFNPRELLARIRAILRRTSGTPTLPAQALRLADVELHAESRSVVCSGRPVTLTGAEFDLLSAFLRNPGKIISREDLTQAALARPMSPMDRSIDVHVSNLRRKLGPYDGQQERIKAIRGSGYVYLLPGEQPA